jgi:glycosyltransferase involved in cell wall biosynthesis
MKLSIITINYNNAIGLQKTIESVQSQVSCDFEYIIIDGNSADGSVEIITQFKQSTNLPINIISEFDSGIYNAMNKGIRIAKGDYVQFLNSSDCLINENVVADMLVSLQATNYPSILYGNLMKQLPGRILRDRSFNGKEITLLGMFTGTLNHSPVYIKRDLFIKYGYYDESLKIVSDWKWYLQVIILGEEKPLYTDIDVTLFDMNGISNIDTVLDKAEREKVLAELFPKAILKDYEYFAYPIEQMKRLQRHKWAYRSVNFLERCLFKFENWTQIEQIYK